MFSGRRLIWPWLGEMEVWHELRGEISGEWRASTLLGVTETRLCYARLASSFYDLEAWGVSGGFLVKGVFQDLDKLLNPQRAQI